MLRILSLRESFHCVAPLVDCTLTIGIGKTKLATRGQIEDIGSFVIDSLIGETSKDLFERSLLHTIIVDIPLILLGLDQTEDESNCMVVLRNANFVEEANLF